MSIEEHIENLEKRMRRLTIGGIIAFLALVAAILATCTYLVMAAKDIKAQNFVVQDENGNRRALLGVDKHNTAGLVIYDREGSPRFVLYLQPSGEQVLRMTDNMKVRRFIVSLPSEANPSVSLLDKNGNVLTALP